MLIFLQEVSSSRRVSCEYDPSIWDFLTAPNNGDDDDDLHNDKRQEEEKQETNKEIVEKDDDDDDDDVSDDESVPGISVRSPREADTRSIKHAQAVLEIVDTEKSYCNDLTIIKRVCTTHNLVFSSENAL